MGLRLFVCRCGRPQRRSSLQGRAHLVAQGLGVPEQSIPPRRAGEVADNGGTLRALQATQRQVPRWLFLVPPGAWPHGATIFHAEPQPGRFVGCC